MLFAGSAGEAALHEDVRDIGLNERFADRAETEVLVERDSLGLRVKAKDIRALAFGLSDDVHHEYAAKAFAMFGGKHSSDAYNMLRGQIMNSLVVRAGVTIVVKESRVGDNLAFAVQCDMRGREIDAIFVKIAYALLDDKDRETGFEDLVEFGCIKFGKRLDVQRDAPWKRRFGIELALFGRVLLLELGINHPICELTHGTATQSAVWEQRAVVLLHLFGQFPDLQRVSQHCVDDRGDFAMMRTMFLLRLGRRSLVGIHVIPVLRAVASTVNEVTFFVVFSADF